MTRRGRDSVAVTLVLGAVLFAGCGETGPGTDAADSDRAAAKSTVGPLAGLTPKDGSRLQFKNVYMGVSCQGRGNYVGCDRVCLFALIRHGDPDYVLATFAGRKARLERIGRKPSAYETCVRRKGLLHDGPLAVRADEEEHWFGSPPVSVGLRLRAVFLSQGGYVEHYLPNARLSAGYG